MKRAILILLVIVMLFSVAACGGGKSDSKEKVEITVANNRLPNSLDPLTEDAAHSYSITHQIYDRLVSFGLQDNAWQPAVAKSWKQVDETTWTFDINLDYKFQNGKQLTMDDVMYSFERLKDVPKQADAAASIADISYEGTTLTIKFTDASLTSPSRLLANVVIINKEYVENGGDDAIYINPIGTGPYKKTEFTPGATATIETWDGYPFEKPQIDIIHFRAIEESSTRYVALETGEVQFIGFINATEYDLAKENPDLDVGNANSRRCWSLVFNCETGPFVDNVNLRKGICYAIDRDSWIQLAGGQRVAQTSMLFNGYPDLYAESDKVPGYDLDKAKELLEGEGVNPNNRLEVNLICVEGDPGLDMLAATLYQLGVDLNINILEHSVYLQKEGAGEFDMAFIPQANRANHPLNDLDRYDSSLIGTRDLARYTNPRCDELIAQMRVESDTAKIKEMAKELNDIVAEEAGLQGSQDAE